MNNTPGEYYNRPEVVREIEALSADTPRVGGEGACPNEIRLTERETLLFLRLRNGGVYETSTENALRLRRMVAEMLTDPIISAKYSIDEIVDTLQADLQREFDEWISLLWSVRCLVIDPVMRAKTAGAPLNVRTVAAGEICSAKIRRALADNNFASSSSAPAASSPAVSAAATDGIHPLLIASLELLRSSMMSLQEKLETEIVALRSRLEARQQ